MNRNNDDKNINDQRIQGFNFELMLPDEMQMMFQELHLHQIELEKQTDELHRVQSEVEDLRNRSEEIILSQLAEISSYYDNAPIGLAVLNTDLCFMRVNKLMAEMNGISVADHIGKTVKELLPELAEQARNAADIILKDGKSIQNIEFIGETAADPGVQHIWMEGWYPLKNSGHKVVGFTVIVQDITEQRRAEEARLESERRYREIFDSSFDAIFIHDISTGTIIDVNQTMLDMYGFANKDEALKCTVADLSAVEDGYNQDKISSTINEAANIIQDSIEWRAKKKNGKLFWVQVSLRKVNITGVDRIMATVRDINECKNMEHQATELMKELQAFYNLAEISEREGITLNELYQEFIDILPQSFQYTEIACARIVINGVNYSTRNFKETEWMISAPINVNGNAVGRIEMFYLLKMPDIYEGPFMKGERLLINALAKRIGQITSRKWTEDALRFKNLAFDVSIVANCIANLDGAITEANEMFLHLWGYANKDEVTGKFIKDFLNIPLEIEEIINALDNAGQWEGEFIAKKKDGTTFMAYGLGSVVLGDNGALIGYQTAIMDITERKRSEEILKNYNAELEQRVTERTAVAENRAHKLNDLSKQLIRAEENERQRIAYILHTEVQQILIAARIALQTGIKKINNSSIIEPLLTVDQMITEALVETTELVHEIVPPVLREGGLVEAITWLSQQMKERHDFHVNIKADDNLVKFDNEVSICAYQAVREMLLNIYKHTNVKNADVHFQMINEKRFKVTVQDNGPGFVINNHQNSNDPNNGFGLYSIRARVEGVGGGVEIDSKPGEGTAISIFLPVKKRKAGKRKDASGA